MDDRARNVLGYLQVARNGSLTTDDDRVSILPEPHEIWKWAESLKSMQELWRGDLDVQF